MVWKHTQKPCYDPKKIGKKNEENSNKVNGKEDLISKFTKKELLYKV